MEKCITKKASANHRIFIAKGSNAVRRLFVLAIFVAAIVTSACQEPIPPQIDDVIDEGTPGTHDFTGLPTTSDGWTDFEQMTASGDDS